MGKWGRQTPERSGQDPEEIISADPGISTVPWPVWEGMGCKKIVVGEVEVRFFGDLGGVESCHSSCPVPVGAGLP